MADSNWLKKHRLTKSYVNQAKNSLDKLRKDVNKKLDDKAYCNVVQNRFYEIMSLIKDIDKSEGFADILKRQMKNYKEKTISHEVLDEARVATLSLKRSVDGICEDFVLLFKSFRLFYVTLTEQNTEAYCEFCFEDLCVGAVVRECPNPNCSKFYHNVCISHWITGELQRTCLSCAGLIHL